MARVAFSGLLDGIETGQIWLSAGSYDFEIPTKGAPLFVSIGERGSTGVQVCHGSNNLYGVTLLPDGFILHAEVRSERAEIEWVAKT